MATESKTKKLKSHYRWRSGWRGVVRGALAQVG